MGHGVIGKREREEKERERERTQGLSILSPVQKSGHVFPRKRKKKWVLKWRMMENSGKRH